MEPAKSLVVRCGLWREMSGIWQQPSAESTGGWWILFCVRAREIQATGERRYVQCVVWKLVEKMVQTHAPSRKNLRWQHIC